MHVIEPRCRNCGAAIDASMHYCPACGQETRLHPPTLREFVHEFAGHYVALEGALWRSLGWLLIAPARLTREYLAGRRRRYVLPLRLYLTLSIVFFLTVRFGDNVVVDLKAGLAEQRAEQAAEACAQKLPAWVCERLSRKLRAAAPVPAASGASAPASDDAAPHAPPTQLSLSRYAPYLALVMVPVLAMWLALAWRSRRWTYGAHVVSALHLQAHGFAWLALAGLLPEAADALVFVVVLGLWASFVFNLKTLHGGAWWWAAMRASLCLLLYLISLLVMSALVVSAMLLID